MSILIEFIPSLFVALAFDFILYLTGAGILKLISLGAFKYKIVNYAEFKALKEKSKQGLLVPYIVGLSFYVLVIFLLASLN